ncbi:MAG: T9SS type A sorting domain-containing protein [Bacteroidota bacterium]
MKAILKTATAIALMLVTVTGMAKEPKLSVFSDDNAKALVFEWNTQNQNTSIKIMDVKGNIIFSEFVKDTDFYNKRFDLKSLEDGDYFLKAENALRSIVYGISIDDEIRILEKKENVKPTFRKVGDNVFLNYLNLDGEQVNIKVWDNRNNLLFEETVKDEMIIEKAFNFNSAPKNSYTIVVSDTNGSYYKDVAL